MPHKHGAIKTRDYDVKPNATSGVDIFDKRGHLIEHISGGDDEESFWLSLDGMDTGINRTIGRRYENR